MTKEELQKLFDRKIKEADEAHDSWRDMKGSHPNYHNKDAHINFYSGVSKGLLQAKELLGMLDNKHNRTSFDMTLKEIQEYEDYINNFDRECSRVCKHLSKYDESIKTCYTRFYRIINDRNNKWVEVLCLRHPEGKLEDYWVDFPAEYLTKTDEELEVILKERYKNKMTTDNE